jgi:hypothetical protein
MTTCASFVNRQSSSSSVTCSSAVRVSSLPANIWHRRFSFLMTHKSEWVDTERATCVQITKSLKKSNVPMDHQGRKRVSRSIGGLIRNPRVPKFMVARMWSVSWLIGRIYTSAAGHQGAERYAMSGDCTTQRSGMLYGCARYLSRKSMPKWRPWCQNTLSGRKRRGSIVPCITSGSRQLVLHPHCPRARRSEEYDALVSMFRAGPTQ